MATRWVVAKPLCCERALELLKPSIEANHFTNDGPCSKETEKFLHTYLNLSSDHSFYLAASGTAALHALASGFNINAGKPLRWATQAITFPSSILGPLRGTLVLDNDPELFGPSMSALIENVNVIDGVIVTNLFGMPCAVLQYVQWCKENFKILIFDNAATPMTYIQSEDGIMTNINNFGDGAIISFHETKPIGRGEGGGIICKKYMAQYVHMAMNFGFSPGAVERICHPDASNWRISDISAAFIRARIELLTSADYARANRLVEQVNTVLMESHISQFVRWLVPPAPCSSIFLSCIMLLTRVPVDIIEFSKMSGIEAKQYYRPLSDPELSPLAWKWFTHCVCLPFQYLCEDVHKVSCGIRELAKHVEHVSMSSMGSC